MTAPIAHSLADHVASYRLPPIARCELCGMQLYTGAGMVEHRRAHEAGTLPYGVIVRYWIDMSKWPELVIIRWGAPPLAPAESNLCGVSGYPNRPGQDGAQP